MCQFRLCAGIRNRVRGPNSRNTALSVVSGAYNLKGEHRYGNREIMAREEGLRYDDHVLKTDL